jgi:serine/threonine protein kinase/WD40 repeat protein
MQSEIDALLKEQEDIGDFLEEPALNAPPKIGETVRAVVAKESKGDQIGPYKILKRLGEGGWGMVYLAEQTVPVRRRVALKVIKLGMDTKSVIARFESERQALALMNHPNIAQVYDAGSTENGRPYFVMEYVHGIQITDYCDQHKLDVRQRLELFILACNAIQHAHQKGIIHRDIKPSNILVTSMDGVASPKVIDFGIAKATGHRLTEKTLFTVAESFIGTPTYMSPEQAEFSGQDVDTRSDIYALGVLLQELLVGRTPFDTIDLQKMPLDQVRRTIREVVPERPSVRLSNLSEIDRTAAAKVRGSEPSRLVQSLRGDLDWIVVKCIEKDRHRRYITVNALASDVQNYLAGQAVMARPPSTSYRLQRLLRRHGAAIATATILAASLIIGSTFSIWQAIRAKDAEAAQAELRIAAEKDREQAEMNAEAAGLNEYIADINLTNLSLSEGNFGRAQQLLDKHLPKVGETDRCGFEWRYLSSLSRGSEHIDFPNQEGSIYSVAFSPNGEMVAVGLREHMNVWDVKTRSLITSLPGQASSIVFIPNTDLLVAASRGGVWVVDTVSWTERIELRGHGGPLAVSADGTKVAASNRDGVVIWDTMEWIEIKQIPGATAPMAFSPDGHVLAANAENGLTLFPLSGEAEIIELDDSDGLFSGFAGFFSALAFSPDGSRIIAPRNARSSRGVFVLSTWDTQTGREMETMAGHNGAVMNLSSRNPGDLLVSASLDHSVGIWGVAKHEQLTTLNGHRSEVWAVDLSPGGDFVISGSKDGALKLWPVDQPDKIDSIEGTWMPLGFSTDGRQMAMIDRENGVSIFDLESRKPVRTFAAGEDVLKPRMSPFDSTLSVSVSADLRWIAYGLNDGKVRLQNTETRNSEVIQVSAENLRFVALFPNGRAMVTRGRGEPMQWWSLDAEADVIETFEAESVIISADSSTMAAFGWEDTVRIIDVASRQTRTEIKVTRSMGYHIALSPDGAFLATSGGISQFDNSVILWDTKNGKRLGRFSGHKQRVGSIAFSPDVRTLATASGDGTVKLWNVSTSQELLSIQRLGSSLRNLTFSPDGQWLAGSGAPYSPNEELYLFRAPNGIKQAE